MKTGRRGRAKIERYHGFFFVCVCMMCDQEERRFLSCSSSRRALNELEEE